MKIILERQKISPLGGGELYFHLQQECKFSEPKIKFYSAEIIVAVEHLHSLNIIYRDLKLENIMLDFDGHIKLVDFGLSKQLSNNENAKTKTFVGTPEYVAPEIIDDEFYLSGYGKEVDWWALGVVMYEMVCGILPFGSNATQETNRLFMKILSQEIDFRAAPRGTSRDIKRLISGLLKKGTAPKTFYIFV